MSTASEQTPADLQVPTLEPFRPSPAFADRYPAVVMALVDEFGGSITVAVIEQITAHEAGRFRNATVQSFLEVLIHKAARNKLAVLVSAATNPVSVRSD